ncbi:TRAM domain-containing protein [Gynuella sp.]|uniref:TRAM domain-containing protein n=1 Tax=Gynuella sp. TaxID=2969146 RepID=UPI003D0EA54C
MKRFKSFQSRKSGRHDASLVGSVIELTIGKYDHYGQGIGWYEGKTVFVPQAMPEERVRVRIIEQKQAVMVAVVEQLLERSADRCEAFCPYYHDCGGCTLQHVPHEIQIQIKQQALADQLQRYAGLQPDRWLQPIVGEEPKAYRSRTKLTLHQGKIGYKRGRSHELVAIEHCPITDLDWSVVVPALKQLPLKQAEIEVCQDDQRRIGVHLILRVKPSQEQLARLQHSLSALTSDYVISVGGVPIAECHDHPLSYGLSGGAKPMNLEFRPSHFTQVNRGVNQLLVECAVAELEPGPDDRIMDLFAGSGNFSLPLAACGASVCAYEGSEELVQQGQLNALHNGFDIEFAALDLFDPQAIKILEGNQANKLLLDPPRSGAKQICEEMSRLNPERIVYVSCNPATLARDAGKLVSQGYSLSRAGVLDMFPHTAHVESIAVFVRARKK